MQDLGTALSDGCGSVTTPALLALGRTALQYDVHGPLNSPAGLSGSPLRGTALDITALLGLSSPGPRPHHHPSDVPQTLSPELSQGPIPVTPC